MSTSRSKRSSATVFSPPPLTLVAAMTRRGVIAAGGQLPWKLPADLRLFRKLTMGGTLLMGSQTFQTLPAPLAGRVNLVLTRRLATAPGRVNCSSLTAALALAGLLGRPTFLVGGAKVYQAGLPFCSQMVISWVEGDVEGDTFFPALDWQEWTLKKEEPHPGFRRCFYHRKNMKKPRTEVQG